MELVFSFSHDVQEILEGVGIAVEFRRVVQIPTEEQAAGRDVLVLFRELASYDPLGYGFR